MPRHKAKSWNDVWTRFFVNAAADFIYWLHFFLSGPRKYFLVLIAVWRFLYEACYNEQNFIQLTTISLFLLPKWIIACNSTFNTQHYLSLLSKVSITKCKTTGLDEQTATSLFSITALGLSTAYHMFCPITPPPYKTSSVESCGQIINPWMGLVQGVRTSCKP